MEYVDLARAESERGEVVLRRRSGDDGPTALELRVNGTYVMDSLETTSERALAAVGLDRVASPRAVLVGGLGLGFTAMEVLADPRVERVTVVEIEAALVGWLRDGTIGHGPQLLADDRLAVTVADIRVALAEASPASYDLVLLDVDNGPDQLVHATNAAVYRAPALQACRRVLRPGGGLLAVWSAHEAPALEAALRAGFDEVDVVRCEVDLQGRAETYLVYVASAGVSRPG